jgi:hypothetical protein
VRLKRSAKIQISFMISTLLPMGLVPIVSKVSH